MNGYTQDIVDLLRCTEEEAVIIEDLMRSQVFHSTLDWVSERQFNKGACEAQRIFKNDRDFFLQAYAERRALFHRWKAEAEATERAVTYEI